MFNLKQLAVDINTFSNYKYARVVRSDQHKLFHDDPDFDANSGTIFKLAPSGCFAPSDPEEIDFYLEHKLAKELNLTELSVCDLGCGFGTANLVFSRYFKRSVGIELDPALYAKALKFKNYMETQEGANLTNLEYIQDDFLEKSLTSYHVFYYFFNHFYDLNFFQELENKIIKDRLGQETIFIIHWNDQYERRLRAPFQYFRFEEELSGDGFRLFYWDGQLIKQSEPDTRP